MFILKSAKPYKVKSGLYYNKRKHKYGLVMEGKFIMWFPDYMTGVLAVNKIINKSIEEGYMEVSHKGYWLQTLMDFEYFTDRQYTIYYQENLCKIKVL